MASRADGRHRGGTIGLVTIGEDCRSDTPVGIAP